MIGSSKNNRGNYPRKCFRTQEKETSGAHHLMGSWKPGLSLTPGAVLIDLRTTGPDWCYLGTTWSNAVRLGFRTGLK